MLRSMTGYGRGEATAGDVAVVVELRSVNNRFRDLQLRCPREYMALEPRINSVLREPFIRGRIDAFVRRSVVGPANLVVADTNLADEYARAISEVRERFGGPAEQPVPLEYILRQPGVLTVTEAPVDVTREWDVVETALNAATSDLLAMRESEGRALQRDLEQQLEELRVCVAEIEAVAAGINERLRQRVEGRVRRLLGDRLDPQRLVMEAAMLADKADVTEELTRLRSHCDQFAQAMETTGAVGRRLDFLLQEMHREVNTIGSKASEHPISQRVVEMKSILERMREQSANVE